MTIATTEDTHATVVAGSVGANLIREAALVMVDAHKLATAIASTQMVPKHFQGKPDECAAAMLYGASLGFDPMQSVRQIYVVHGQAALYARAMDALVKGAGHETWTVATSDESVTVAGQRRGSQRVEESTWTFDRAKRAGYTNNEKYRTDPQAMLYSKALSEVCRKIAPDVLNGVYSVEEMQMERVTVEQVGGLAAILPPVSASPAAPSDPSAGVEPTPPTGDAELDPLSDKTRGLVFALMEKVRISDPDDQRAFLSDTLGRTVESRASLTEAEGVTAGKRLRLIEQGDPSADWTPSFDAEVVDPA